MKKGRCKPNVLACTHTLSTEKDNDEFKAGLGYTVRLQLKKPKVTKIKADKRSYVYDCIYMKCPKKEKFMKVEKRLTIPGIQGNKKWGVDPGQ